MAGGQQMPDGADATATGPVLENEIRVAGDMLLQVVRGQRSVHVIRAARRMAEHHLYRFSFVKLLRGLRSGWRNGTAGKRRHTNKRAKGKPSKWAAHSLCPLHLLFLQSNRGAS
jgi:hypothetical protein